MSGALLAIALVILGTRLFGLSHLLTSGFIRSALALAVVLIAALGRTTRFDSPWRSADRTPLFLAAIVARATARVAAWLLPVGQWDSHGYHLPYVNFALQDHATFGVPDGAPDISTYPHAIKLLVVALRALLPDDRLVDLAQIPFAILAAIANAGLSRKVGAHRKAALGAGAAWLVVPGESARAPSCSAASSRSASRRLRSPMPRSRPRSSRSPCFAILGVPTTSSCSASRCSAPRSSPAKLWSPPRSSTPIRSGWAREIGPLHLPGRNDLREILESGAGAPHLRGPLWARVFASLTSFTAPPVCDMRYTRGLARSSSPR